MFGAGTAQGSTPVWDMPRPPARIVRVPPPAPGAALAGFVWVILLVCALEAGGFALAVGLARGARLLVALIGAGCIVATAGLMLLVHGVVVRRGVARRAEFLQRFRDYAEDGAAAAVAATLELGKTPGPDAILEALRASSPPGSAATIVCLGVLEVPAAGDFRFEPVIITPTRWLWRRLWAVPVAAAIVAIWVLEQTHILPASVHFQLGSFSYPLALGVMVSVAWVWRTTIRPTYLRLAPGAVEVLQYRLRGGSPTIRSYPMAEGTVAIITGAGRNASPYHLTLMRGDNRDEIPVWQMQRRQDAIAQLWSALLSTAPTPPLPRDALVG